MIARKLYWILAAPMIVMTWFMTTFVHDSIIDGIVVAVFFLPALSVVLKYKPNDNVVFKSPKILNSLRKHFMKWLIYNAATFAFLSVFYVPYQIYFIQLSGIQFWKWFLTTGFLGSAVNIIMRPYVGVITRYLDRRYGKALNTSQVPSISEDS